MQYPHRRGEPADHKGFRIVAITIAALNRSIVIQHIGQRATLLILHQFSGVTDDAERHILRALLTEHAQTATVGKTAVEISGYEIIAPALNDEGEAVTVMVSPDLWLNVLEVAACCAVLAFAAGTTAVPSALIATSGKQLNARVAEIVSSERRAKVSRAALFNACIINPERK